MRLNFLLILSLFWCSFAQAQNEQRVSTYSFCPVNTNSGKVLANQTIAYFDTVGTHMSGLLVDLDHYLASDQDSLGHLKLFLLAHKLAAFEPSDTIESKREATRKRETGLPRNSAIAGTVELTQVVSGKKLVWKVGPDGHFKSWLPFIHGKDCNTFNGVFRAEGYEDFCFENYHLAGGGLRLEVGLRKKKKARR